MFIRIFITQGRRRASDTDSYGASVSAFVCRMMSTGGALLLPAERDEAVLLPRTSCM